MKEKWIDRIVRVGVLVLSLVVGLIPVLLGCTVTGYFWLLHDAGYYEDFFPGGLAPIAFGILVAALCVWSVRFLFRSKT